MPADYKDECAGIASIVYGGIRSSKRIYVYLHGLGEFGGDHARQYQYSGFARLLRDNKLTLEYPFVLACCKSGEHWQPESLKSYLDKLKQQFDNPEIDLIGYSRGGAGVYSYLALNADIRSATVINSRTPVPLSELNNVPLHIIHATEDQFTPIEHIRSIVNDFNSEFIQVTEWEGDHFSVGEVAHSEEWLRWIEDEK